MCVETEKDVKTKKGLNICPYPFPLFEKAVKVVTLLDRKSSWWTRLSSVPPFTSQVGLSFRVRWVSTELVPGVGEAEEPREWLGGFSGSCVLLLVSDLGYQPLGLTVDLLAGLSQATSSLSASVYFSAERDTNLIQKTTTFQQDVVNIFFVFLWGKRIRVDDWRAGHWKGRDSFSIYHFMSLSP